MSEYQYHEWQTLGRRLSAEEQNAVDGLSSHIDVTATQALLPIIGAISGMILLKCWLSISMPTFISLTGGLTAWPSVSQMSW